MNYKWRAIDWLIDWCLHACSELVLNLPVDGMSYLKPIKERSLQCMYVVSRIYISIEINQLRYLVFYVDIRLYIILYSWHINGQFVFCYNHCVHLYSCDCLWLIALYRGLEEDDNWTDVRQHEDLISVFIQHEISKSHVSFLKKSTAMFIYAFTFVKYRIHRSKD
jgi:hypothetical protein